jgi:hypothetical protein
MRPVLASAIFGAAVLAWLGAFSEMRAQAATENDVVFSEYSKLSSNLELARRMLSPLEAAQLPQLLAQMGKGLREQPIDLAQETFALAVPSQPPPPKGYGLIVFVPPWDSEKFPGEWLPVLDRYGFIMVSAAHSGNDKTVLGRRAPLALLAEQNVVRHYPVDPERIFISGFSGGSRVAMQLAVAYPDVFRGAILNAGGDRIGTSASPLPPRDLFLQFQSTSRLVYVTGDEDTRMLNSSSSSIRYAHDWCVFGMDSEVEHATDHEAMSASALARALDTLLAMHKPDDAKLASCRAGIETDLDAKLQQVQSLIAGGNRDAAQQLLNEIDAQFGGLAAPRSLDLQRSLTPQ